MRRRRLVALSFLLLAAALACDEENRENPEAAPRPTYIIHEDLPGLARDIPLPPHELEFSVGGGGTVYWFSPRPDDVSASLASELLIFYEEGLQSEGWVQSDEEVADDGAWTAGWTKDNRVVRLTFAPRLLGDKVSLAVEQCPPDAPVKCGPGRLFPFNQS